MTTEGTFIFADLVGFTAYTEREGDEAAADLAEEFCARVCSLNRGHQAEDVKLLGDGCLIRASDPALGLDLATHIVERVGPEHGFPRVRVGCDFGPAVERNADWFGMTVNVASRLAALADQGSVLATRSLVENAGSIVGIAYRSLGARRLSGVSEALDVFAVERIADPEATHRALALGKEYSCD